MIASLLAALAVLQAPNVEKADDLAAAAVAAAASDPAACLAEANRALGLTQDFEPTVFVTAGRKGEVVEDEYLAARASYREHRAGLYRAVGLCHLAGQRPLPAARYLRRAYELAVDGRTAGELASALIDSGEAEEALGLLVASAAGEGLSRKALQTAGVAADAVRLPSLQTEIDRARIAKLKGVSFKSGPFPLTRRARLSTGVSFRFEDHETVVVYISDASCRSCSADLQLLSRLDLGDALVLLGWAGDDAALRGVVRLYKYDWRYLDEPGWAEKLGLPAPSMFVVARSGWSAAVVERPFGNALRGVIETLARPGVTEARPRRRWNRRPYEPSSRAPQPALLPEGLAPGEDAAAPPEFEQAVAAYRSGQAKRALRLFEAIAQRGDGWLLPPEERLNRAMCLAEMGRREQARKLLLRTGDSRFQERVDRALEEVGGSESQ